MKFIEKIEDLYFDIRRFSIKDFFIDLKRWFSYYKVTRKIVDFDYSSVLIVELHQLKRLYDSISYYQSSVDASRDLERIQTAINLLDIYLNEDSAKFNGTRSTENSIIQFNGYYTISKYVNTRNASRYLKCVPEYSDPFIGALFKETLRKEKAWKLYYKYRSQYMRGWWD